MIKELDKYLFANLFISGAHNLENNKQAINDLNVFPVPDGDTGTNMSRTMMSAVAQLVSNDFENAGKAASAVASATLRGARGNSGVILSQILRGFSNAVKDCSVIRSGDFTLALESASKTAYRAVMKPTEGTILTVIRVIAETINELDDDGDIVSLLEAVCEIGNRALESTPDMLPALKKAGVVDAGGKGLMCIFEGMLYYLKNNKIIEVNEKNELIPESLPKTAEEIKFRYCTEFIIKKSVPLSSSVSFKNSVAHRGDSLLVIDDDGIIKVHIHTNNPGYVLEKAVEFGELIDIKIENMKQQHNEIISKETSPYAIISVCAGEGVADLMTELGATYVISGGQTMNPSAEDILQAIGSVTADNIFVLPNNSNIILTAEQAAEISEKNVFVVKSKSIPQGIAALSAFDDTIEPDKNLENMNSALQSVKTGLITYAIRNTEVGEIEVKKDDYIAIYEKDIVASGQDSDAVVMELAKKAVNDEITSVLLIWGEGASEEEVNELSANLEAEYPDCEINVIPGGQPVYRYIISFE